MTLAQQYAEACIPDTWTVFGIRLRPFSIGHYMLLERIGSPLLGEGQPTPADIVIALYLCHRPASEMISRWDRPMPRVWRFLAWKIAFLSSIKPVMFLSRYAMLSRYIGEAIKPPNHWRLPEEESIELTAPFAATLIRGAMTQGYTSTEALDLPLRRLRFEHLAGLENDSKGKFKFVTDQEAALAKGQAA